MDGTISRDAAIDEICDIRCGESKFDCESYKNRNYISDCDYIRSLLNLPSAQPEQQWVSAAERMPEEDHWLGGSGRQFSDEVLVSVANYDDEDTWIYISQTIDGEWALELPGHCKIIAWMPLPEPYRGE